MAFAAVVALAAVALVLWMGVPMAQIELQALVPPGVMAFLWALGLALNRLARSAFREFAPVLQVDDAERAELERQLTDVPDRVFLGGLALIHVPLVAGIQLNADTEFSLYELPVGVVVLALVLWELAILAGMALVVQTLRQLRLVSHLYDRAVVIDLFDLAPVNALSRLTAATAVGILVFAAIFVDPDDLFSLATGAAPLLALAAASFVWPLRGMHRRLAAEKGRLLEATHRRLKVTLERIHESVDRNDVSHADGLQKTLSSLLAERDVLLRLPTWPWSPGTIRGIASAMLLPIILWLTFRILDRMV